MAENTAFSSSGEDVINRTITIEEGHDLLQEEFEDYYDIDRTVEEIVKGGYKRIALQFPDELLHDSVPIFRLLKSRIGPGSDLYVLADTSYGSCCVDEVAAQHVDADAMVHYGHACMSQTSRLPVVYVFGKKALDMSDCTSHLVTSLRPEQRDSSTIWLKTDVVYSYIAQDIAAKLQLSMPSCQIFYTPIPLFSCPSGGDQLGEHDGSDKTIEGPSGAQDGDTIFYVGGESLTLTNLLMTHASCEVHSYDPKSAVARIESSRTNKLLMRRYAAVQKARDADVFGILVGTLGVASYLPLISRLRTLLSRSRKKSYTITVGKLNPSKLGNFLEIECFVLVACPENSLVEAKEFLRPIITPFELEIALQAEPEWTGQYILDFGKLSLESSDSPENPDDDKDQPIFSLVTGKYRQRKYYGADAEAPVEDDNTSSAVILRNADSTVSVLQDSAAGQFLQSRTFQGLETRIGEDLPSVLEQGRSGIARGYQTDHR